MQLLGSWLSKAGLLQPRTLPAAHSASLMYWMNQLRNLLLNPRAKRDGAGRESFKGSDRRRSIRRLEAVDDNRFLFRPPAASFLSRSARTTPKESTFLAGARYDRWG